MLELYLTMYRRVAGGGVYIDGFAGTGAGMANGVAHDGSPIIALASGAFRSHWLFELDPLNAAALSSLIENRFPRRGGSVRLQAVDCNLGIVELLNSPELPRDKPMFALLDQLSTQLDWSTVKALAKFKEPVNPPTICRTELFILFNAYPERVVLRFDGYAHP